jgi:hypothetical protein
LRDSASRVSRIRFPTRTGTKIPLDTPLARLVMADPAIGVIERDIALPHIIAPV